MPKKVFWLITLFTVLFITALFIIRTNTGAPTGLHNLANTICLSCIGVG